MAVRLNDGLGGGLDLAWADMPCFYFQTRAVAIGLAFVRSLAWLRLSPFLPGWLAPETAEPTTGVAGLTARRSTAARSAIVVFTSSRSTVFRARLLGASRVSGSRLVRKVSATRARWLWTAADPVHGGRSAQMPCLRIPLPNAEITGRRRRGTLAARQMMNHTATRPGSRAVGGPVERRVRRRFGFGLGGPA